MLFSRCLRAPEPAPQWPLEGAVTISTSDQNGHRLRVPGVDTPVKIMGFDDVHIAFYGSNTSRLNIISGVIDRVTGAVEATAEGPTFQKEFGVSMTDYSLKCRPAQRMF